MGVIFLGLPFLRGHDGGTTHFLFKLFLSKAVNLATTNFQKQIGTIRAPDLGVIRDFQLGWVESTPAL